MDLSRRLRIAMEMAEHGWTLNDDGSATYRDGTPPPLFMYWPPWKTTLPGIPRVKKGGDELHRTSLLIQLPFLGAFIFFATRRPNLECTCADDGDDS